MGTTKGKRPIPMMEIQTPETTNEAEIDDGFDSSELTADGLVLRPALRATRQVS
jgi:hypothetical protein